MILNVTIRGQTELDRKLRRLADSLDTRGILDESGAVLFQRIRKRFLDQKDPDGQTWIPSRASLRRSGGGTLYDTGRLFRSIQLYASSGNTRAIGTNVPYASIHNFGTSRLPRRQFLGFGDEDATVVERLIIKRITEALQ